MSEEKAESMTQEAWPSSAWSLDDRQPVSPLNMIQQQAPYMDPPGMESRVPSSFEPVTLVAYLHQGGREVWRQHIRSEHEYAGQLQSVQTDLNREFLSRVDILRLGTTDLLGSLLPQSERNQRFLKYG